jgi:ATP/maltotriose-dependent transcriptional regulator MalT
MTQVERAPQPRELEPSTHHHRTRRAALIGRDDEVARLRSFIARIPEHGSALAMTGDPGVGKSALVDQAVDYARWRGIDVMQASGVEAEQDVPWATLHQLLHVLRDRLPDLPGPQRDGIRAVFGEVDGISQNVFLTGLAALTLLSDRATDAGLLIVVEDIHWVDPSTRTVLEFLARRVGSEPIGILLTSRSSDPVATESISTNAQAFEVHPLGEEESRRLLADRRESLPPTVLERVIEEAMGNPLALIELSAAGHRLREISATSLPLTAKLERAFAHRLVGLDPAEQSVILVAAVSADPHQGAVLDGASRLLGEPIDAHTVDSLILKDLLLRTRGELKFRHPLVRSAVMQNVSARQRARAHRAVASLLPTGTDRQLWHLAIVAEEPHEPLASALDTAAARSLNNGDPITALAAYRRAAELSPSPEDRARRTYRAAAVALGNRFVLEAKELLDEVAHQPLDPALTARIAWLRQLIPGSALERGDVSITITIADDLHGSGQSQQAISLFTSFGAQHWGAFPEGPIWEAMIERAEVYGAAPNDPRLLWLKAFGMPGVGSQQVRDAIDAIEPGDVHDVEALTLLAVAYALSGALERSSAFMDRALGALRETGNLPALATTMLSAAVIHGFAGRLRQMLSTADEAHRLAEEARQPFLALAAHLTTQLARAMLGDDIEIDRLGERFPDASSALGQNPFLVMKFIAAGIADAGSGRPRQAWEQLRRSIDPGSPVSHWAWGFNVAFLHFVDAAARSGHHPDAWAQVHRLEAMTGLANSPQHRSQLVVATALLSSDSDPRSDDAFRDAISPDHDELPYWRARALLAYGERLRRQRRITEARSHLRQARDEFDRMHVAQWADHARAELEAAGESSPRRPNDLGAALTPQEDRVAGLAKQGLSNREIAERLFLSPRTVGTHLHSVYRKLAISSRSELRTLDD